MDNSLPKRESRRSLVPMADQTLSMSTATIPALPGPFCAARRFSALELRIERGRRFATQTEGEEAPENNNGAGVARNPLKRPISDERIQGIPSKSNRPKPGNSRSPDARPRRPEEIQMSRDQPTRARPLQPAHSLTLRALWRPSGHSLFNIMLCVLMSHAAWRGRSARRSPGPPARSGADSGRAGPSAPRPRSRARSRADRG